MYLFCYRNVGDSIRQMIRNGKESAYSVCLSVV